MLGGMPKWKGGAGETKFKDQRLRRYCGISKKAWEIQMLGAMPKWKTKWPSPGQNK